MFVTANAFNMFFYALILDGFCFVAIHVNALQSEQSIAMAATANIFSNTIDDIQKEKKKQTSIIMNQQQQQQQL